MQLELTYLYSIEYFCYFFYAQAPNSDLLVLTQFCNLISNKSSLEMGQVIKMSLQPNERYDLNS